MQQPTPGASSANPSGRRRKYVPAVGPRLKKLLSLVFALFALLAASSAYLLSVSILEWATEQVYQDWSYLIVFMIHLVLGLLFILPVLAFGLLHLKNARKRPNRRAVRVGYALFATALILIVSGIMLTRLDLIVFRLELKDSAVRSVAYWAHVVTPFIAAWLFVLHRLAGKRIRWKVGLRWTAAAAGFAAIMLALHLQDPRAWNVAGNPRGEKYFHPSLARTVSGDFIPATILSNDAYCQECHADVHEGWAHSVHRFASFNNPAYLATVRQTRQVLFERDGSVHASRFCAGCHDPVPFFSGEFDQSRFDDPDYDLSQDRMANAGITCTVCHSISNINSPRGNADYTIDEPIHYPFAFSQNRFLKWTNRQLVKAKPEFHKRTFLKPLHQSTLFCGTCHKVHLPEELNQYKWLRGQNHQDSFLLSGVSGHNPASFYYPEKAETNCNDCHMPLVKSEDFGARDFDGSGLNKVHDHQFPSANTAIPHLLGLPSWVNEKHQRFNDGVMRVDLFGVKKGGEIDSPLEGPLRPAVPELQPGAAYLLEVVVRTLKMGHDFTQGTSDSNQVWLEIALSSDSGVRALSGGVSDDRIVDPDSHFINTYMLDRNGKRIDRRNAEDIFVPLYNNQIPPGAADTVHFRFTVPPGTEGKATIRVRLNYRKFDTTYFRFFKGDESAINDLPVMVLAEDRVEFPIAGSDARVENGPPPADEWERWNDYGIGLLRKGQRGQLRQAIEAFKQVERLGRPQGPINLARAYLREGLVQTHAPEALARAADFDPPAPPWTLLWLSAQVDKQNGRFDEAISGLRELIQGGFPEAKGRGFDFSKDWRTSIELGQVLLRKAQRIGRSEAGTRDSLLREAEERFQQALVLEPENVAAHWGLRQVYQLLRDRDKALVHSRLHAKYKPDDNARDTAISIARRENPAANRAAEAVVVYDLKSLGNGYDSLIQQARDRAMGRAN